MNRALLLSALLVRGLVEPPEIGEPEPVTPGPGPVNGTPPNTYEAARRELRPSELRRVRHDLRRLLARRPIDVHASDAKGIDWASYMVQVTVPGLEGILLILATSEVRGDGLPAEAHLSVRVVHPDGTGRAPVWRELVLARALAWPDHVEVLQIMPPAGQYLNLHADVLHLWGPRP